MFTYLIIVAGALVFGNLFRRVLTLPKDLSGLFASFLLGLAVCALVGITLGSFSLASAQLLIAVCAALGLTYSFLKKKSNEVAAHASPKDGAPYTFLECCCLGASLSALLIALLGSLAPLTSWDACVAHIALPSDYAREGHIYTHPGNVYSAYPHLMHSLWAVAYLHGGEFPVKLLSWCMGLAAVLAIYSLGKKMAGRECGLIAGAILATAPIFLDQAGAVSLDLAFSAFSLMSLVALTEWFENRQYRWLIVAALLAGTSCGIRHTGLLVCLILMLGLLLASSPGRLKAGSLFAGMAALAAAPWLLRAYLVSGNPLFPFLSLYFSSPNFDHINITGLGAHESVRMTGGLDWLKLLRFPWDIIMRPGAYDGWTKSPGGLILAFGLPGFLLGGKRARFLAAYSISGGLAFFFFQRLARYLLPFFAPMMVVAGMGVLALKPFRKVACCLLLLSFSYGLALDIAAIHFKIPVVLGRESREAYLQRRVERYPAFQYANSHLPQGECILTVDQRSYYLRAPSYQNHWALKRVARQDKAAQLAWLRSQGVKYILAPREYLANSGALAKTVGPMMTSWRTDTKHFRLIDSLEIPCVRSAGFEHVDVLEVLDE